MFWVRVYVPLVARDNKWTLALSDKAAVGSDAGAAVSYDKQRRPLVSGKRAVSTTEVSSSWNRTQVGWMPRLLHYLQIQTNICFR